MKLLVRVTALLILLTAPVGATHLPQTEPDPSLSPQDVVSIQIEALRNNDIPYEDRGIEVTFHFASTLHDSGGLEGAYALWPNPSPNLSGPFRLV